MVFCQRESFDRREFFRALFICFQSPVLGIIWMSPSPSWLWCFMVISKKRC